MASQGVATLESQESGMTITPSDRHEILYFAYGSNLSSSQMLRRCPQSSAVGLGYLHGWEWLINERGFANIVPVPRFRRRVVDNSAAASAAPGQVQRRGGRPVEGKGKGRQVDSDDDEEDEDEDEDAMTDDSDDGADGLGAREPIPDEDLPGVYGVLYLLPPEDEALLDGFEGVPSAYEKFILQVEMVDENDDDEAMDEDGSESSAELVDALVYVDRARVSEGRPRAEYVQRMNLAVEEAEKEWGLPEWYVESVIRRFIPE